MARLGCTRASALLFAMLAAPSLAHAASPNGDAPKNDAPKNDAPKNDRPTLEAKFGKGLKVETADGDYAIRIGARAQLRSSVLVPEEDGADPSVDFQVRRLRLSIDGHAFDELVTYKIQLAFTPLDQDPVAVSAVRDAQVFVHPLRDLHLRVGQGKVPFGRQRVVSSGSQQFVDRSVVVGELNLDRDVGVVAYSDDLGGLDEWLGYSLAVFGGDGRNRVSGGYGLLYAARLELRPLGGAPELDEPDLKRSPKPRLYFAFAGAFNHQTDRERSTLGAIYETGPWVDYAHGAFDWRFKWKGLSVTGELLARKALEETNTADVEGELVTDVARSGMGGFVQAGQMLDDTWEVAARYGTMHPIGDRRGDFPHEREVGGAVSAYFAGHALKLQADYHYLFEPGGDGRHLARLQLQIAP
jgi:hypothetical protein